MSSAQKRTTAKKSRDREVYSIVQKPRAEKPHKVTLYTNIKCSFYIENLIFDKVKNRTETRFIVRSVAYRASPLSFGRDWHPGRNEIVGG